MTWLHLYLKQHSAQSWIAIFEEIYSPLARKEKRPKSTSSPGEWNMNYFYLHINFVAKHLWIWWGLILSSLVDNFGWILSWGTAMSSNIQPTAWSE
jgi:hypothetical protein